jgi:hypothetical protein
MIIGVTTDLEITDLGEAEWFLGIKINRKDDNTILS